MDFLVGDFLLAALQVQHRLFGLALGLHGRLHAVLYGWGPRVMHTPRISTQK